MVINWRIVDFEVRIESWLVILSNESYELSVNSSTKSVN